MPPPGQLSHMERSAKRDNGDRYASAWVQIRKVKPKIQNGFECLDAGVSMASVVDPKELTSGCSSYCQ